MDPPQRAKGQKDSDPLQPMEGKQFLPEAASPEEGADSPGRKAGFPARAGEAGPEDGPTTGLKAKGFPDPLQPMEGTILLKLLPPRRKQVPPARLGKRGLRMDPPLGPKGQRIQILSPRRREQSSSEAASPEEGQGLLPGLGRETGPEDGPNHRRLKAQRDPGSYPAHGRETNPPQRLPFPPGGRQVFLQAGETGLRIGPHHRRAKGPQRIPILSSPMEGNNPSSRAASPEEGRFPPGLRGNGPEDGPTTEATGQRDSRSYPAMEGTQSPPEDTSPEEGRSPARLGENGPEDGPTTEATGQRIQIPIRPWREQSSPRAASPGGRQVPLLAQGGEGEKKKTGLRIGPHPRGKGQRIPIPIQPRREQSSSEAASRRKAGPPCQAGEMA
ncbi:basic salivary proline-rich protein 2-like [Macrobrachium nipponense]|uniref:basic salivary proline-rich protein 2-like n=1 Tax=Macrobrachium nipponense TaxID=159736 RepID=UPI0030C825FE